MVMAIPGISRSNMTDSASEDIAANDFSIIDSLLLSAIDAPTQSPEAPTITQTQVDQFAVQAVTTPTTTQAQVDQLAVQSVAAPAITPEQVGQFVAGFQQALAQIDANIVAQVLAESLPIVGDNLRAAADGGALQLHYVARLGEAIVNGLQALSVSDNSTAAQIESAVDASLAAAGFSGVGVTADLSDASDIRLIFTTYRAGDTVSVPIESDLGLANLGLHASGNAQTTFSDTFNFTAGLDGGGYYVATEGATLGIHSDTRLPGFSVDATMASIPFRVADNASNHTGFLGDFQLMLKDPGGDGRLRAGELGGDLVDATFSGNANIHLDLDSILPAAAAMPQIGTDLGINWQFSGAVVNPADDNTQFGGVPEVRFNNSTLNLGSFFNNFAGRALDEITRVTGPLQPVIDLLTAPIPILSDLGSNKVTLLDFAGLTPLQTAAIEGLADIAVLGGKVSTFTNDGNVQIDLGSLLVGGDLRIDRPEDLLVDIVRQPTAIINQNGDAKTFLEDVAGLGGGGLSFPILSDFKNIGDLLLGKNIDLFEYKNTMGFDTQFAQYFPVLGPVGVKLSGLFGMAAQFDFGFDTQGLKDFVNDGLADPGKVYNGFYARATDDAGLPATGFQIHAGVQADAEVNVGVANAGVGGDLTATVDFALNGTLDPTGTGKVRGGTLAGTAVGDLFDPGGEMTTGLHAYLEVGIGPFSIGFSFDSPRVVLVNFDGGNANPPVIANDLGNGDLALNVGPRSAQRLVGNLLDRAETVAIHNYVHPVSGAVTGLRLDAYKFTEIHNFPGRIAGDGGDHADTLALDPDVNIPAVFTGGANRDLLTGGAAGDNLGGGDGPDVLSGNGGADTLMGGAGSDRLIGGAGGDLLDGGDGEDTASFATAPAGMVIDLRAPLFTGDGVGDTLMSIERYEGTNFDDAIDGGDGFNGLLGGLDGNDTIHGNGGDDLLDGGKGDDTLDGGAGEDFLVGGPGADTIEGSDGIDTVAYTSSKTPVAVSLRTGLGTGGDAQGDVLSHVEVLLGSPLPFGDLSSRYVNGKPVAAGTGDTLEGGDGDDAISGLGGADAIDGGAGNDMLYGDAAGITGGLPSAAGFDQDTLRGGLGDDRLWGQEEDDDLDGGLGHDLLDGGEGDDHLRTLDLGSADILDGGTGVNRLSADYSDKPVPIVWIAGQNNDYSFADGDIERNFQNVGELVTGHLDDVIRLNGVADDAYGNVIRANGGNDLVYTGLGNDYVDGGEGDDYVNGGDTWVEFVYDSWGSVIGHQGNADELHGGAGNDTVDFSQLRKTSPSAFQDGPPIGGLGVYVNLATHRTAYAAEGIVISGFENIVGTDWHDTLIGDDGPNVFRPLRGGGLVGGPWVQGPDRIDGAGGEDTLVIDFSAVESPNSLGVVSGAGYIYSRVDGVPDWLGSRNYDDYRYDNIERLDIIGTSKDDELHAPGIKYGDILRGLGGNDVLTGGVGGADTLLGGNGNDTLSGQMSYSGAADGRDVLDGGAGDDLVEDIGFDYYGSPALAADALFQLDGGSGFDTLSVSFSNQTVPIVWDSAAPTSLEFADGAYARDFEALRYFASGAGNDAITQRGRVDNRLYLGAGDDTVNPGLGVDSVEGGAGFDTAILDFSTGDTAEMTGVQGTGGQDGGSYARWVANSPWDSIVLRGFERVLITGSSKNDSLVGTSGDDTLIGGDGNDVLDGYVGGNNVLDGGNGDDVLKGSYYGAGADDTLYGGAGHDTLLPVTGNDTAFGGDGNDIIRATDSPVTGSPNGYGTDVFEAGDGDDAVEDFSYAYSFQGYTRTNGATRLKLDGGAGFDTLSADYGNQAQAIGFTDGIGNSVDFADGSYFRNFEALGNFIAGSGGDTLLLSGRRDNKLAGGDGNDTVNPGLGVDIVYGGAGDDLLILDYSAGDDANVGGVTARVLSLGQLDLEFQRRDLNTNAPIDNLTVGEFERLQVTGGGKADSLLGGAGADTLAGNAGNDTLDGGAGVDSLIGGPGDDAYAVNVAGDAITENAGEGVDTVQSRSWSYTLPANVENLTLLIDGSSGTGNALDNILTGSEGYNILDGGAGNDTLDGAGGGDILNGGEGDDILNGGAGNGRLDGGAGADTMAGGAGDDIYTIDNAGDHVTESAGEGFDEARSSVSCILAANVEILTLTGTAAIDATGNELANYLFGNSGHNALDGGLGNDILSGGAGDDTYTIDSAGDSVGEAVGGGADTVRSSVSYTLGANLENLILTGTADANTAGNELANRLAGNGGNNVLDGGLGDDFLDGGAGADTLKGGAGNDTYGVDHAGDSVVEAFAEGYDTVQSSVSHTLAANLENLTLTGTAALDGIGNVLANRLIGNGGHNVLDGGLGWGNDFLDGGAGTDTLKGGDGDDTYTIDNVGDSVVEAVAEGYDTVQSSVSYTLTAGVSVEKLILTETADIDAAGNEFSNILVGNSGHNVLDGGLGDDFLDGGTGADTLKGGAGDDTYVIDHAGNRVTEYAGEGVDQVQSSVSYTLAANAEQLILTGTAAIDATGNELANYLLGNTGSNVLDGGLGNDILDSWGSGTDTLKGGDGDDTYYVYDDAGDSVTESASEGVDKVYSSVSYTLPANVENLTLTDWAWWSSIDIDAAGNELDNLLTGNYGINVLDGGLGNDTLQGGEGNDTLQGGGGNDTYVVDDAGDRVTENTNEGSDTVQSSVSCTLAANVENLTLTGTTALTGTGNGLANILQGNGTANRLNGGAGADTLKGWAGDDILYGGAGADTLYGGAGNDVYGVDNAGDSVTETAGTATDTVQSWISYTLGNNVEKLQLLGTAALNGTGNALGNTLQGNGAANRLNGGAGVDTLSGGAGNDTYGVDNAGDSVVEYAGAGLDTVQSAVSHTLAANVENLALTGTAAIDGAGNGLANTLQGNSAANRLNGGTGVDTLAGGDGNDTYVVDNSGDVVTETNTAAAQIDTIQSWSAYTLGANVENLRLLATGSVNGTGNALNNILYAGAGNNVLDGGAGIDTVSYAYAAAGITAGLATTAAQATAGSGNDTLLGVENLTGGNYSDTLTGNGGSNVLVGGLGKDTLVGGLGADIFKFNTAAETNAVAALGDLIQDFNASQGDKINLSAIDANSALAGDQAFTAPTQGGVFSGVFASQGSLYFDQTTHVLYGNNDADSAADFAIQLAGISSLSINAVVF
jgi:Ca2+-binding RTX toxin-like protein